MAANSPADRPPELLTATILRYRRGWKVMWIGTGHGLRDFSTAMLTQAVARASTMAAKFFSADPSGASAEFLLLIFGRSLPVFIGPQLIVTGEPGQFMATDARENSVFNSATLEDLLITAGADPARPGDYAISWIRPMAAV